VLAGGLGKRLAVLRDWLRAAHNSQSCTGVEDSLCASSPG
jgi:hypothetical protein